MWSKGAISIVGQSAAKNCWEGLVAKGCEFQSHILSSQGAFPSQQFSENKLTFSGRLGTVVIAAPT